MKRSLYLLLCLLIPQLMLAQDFKFRTDRYTNRVQSTFFTPSYTISMTNHDKWTEMKATPSVADAKYKFKSVENIIRLGINHTYAGVVAAYKYKVEINITGFDYKSPTTRPESVTLDLSYDPDSLHTFNDLSVYRCDSAFHAIRVEISKIYKIDPSTGTPTLITTGIAPNFFVEAEVAVQRYDLPAKKITLRNDLEPGNKNLKVTWGVFNTGTLTSCVLPDTLTSDEFKPVVYELEWSYIDDYQYNMATNTTANKFSGSSASPISYDFRRNSTRVQVSAGRSFKIPLTYERGALIYRVRMLRPSAVNYSDIQYGDWSLADYGSLDPKSSCFAGQGYVIENAHTKDSLNWQYTINFAEDGKYKHVINYFDGSLKDRQTQTKINTDNNYIIAVEKVYDYEGRPSIVSLPVPVNGQNDLDYRKDILLNKSTNNPYRAPDFDGLGCSLPDSIAPLSDNAMANKYYSPLNPDKGGMQQFVPDAKGYPVVQTIYSPDNTNKVRYQGGPGLAQQTWKNHATQYEYTRPLQQDIDRLLGTEAGYYQYYPKQIVTDPNGQSSFTIMNPSGKIVVSGLQGSSPDSALVPVDTLTNYVRGAEVCQDLLLDYRQEKTQDALNAALPFYNDVQGDATLKYRVRVFPYFTGCSGQYLWAAAQYEVNAVNDCGQKMITGTGTVGESKVTASGGDAYITTDLLRSNMQKGNYIANKKLRFSEYDVHHLVETFVYTNEPSCYKDVHYFIKQAIDSTKFPCEKSTDSSENMCDKAKKEMMQQLYPGYKYGLYRKNEDSTFKEGLENSIFSLSGKTRKRLKPLLESGIRKDGSVLGYLEDDLNWTASCDNIYYTKAKGLDYGAADPSLLPSDPAFEIVRKIYGYCNPPYPADWYFRANLDIAPTTDLSNIYYAGWLQYGDYFSMSVNGGVPLVCPGVQVTKNPDGSMRKVTGLVYGTNQLELKISGVPVSPSVYANFWGRISEQVTEPMYRYQDSCIHLPDSVVKDGRVYKKLKELPVQTFIEIFNDDIAEALLSLHPEYCKLLNCDGGSFEAMLENTNSLDQAMANNMFVLDSLIAHDPMQLHGAPGIAEKLSRFQNLSRTKLDSFAIRQAYCGAGNGMEMAYCIADNFKYEIDHFIFRNDEIKQRYFDYLKSFYIGNRTLIKQQFLDGTAVYCSPCNDQRLKLTGIPVFPSLTDALSSGPGPGSVPGSVPGTGSAAGDLDGLPEWMKELFNKAIAEDTTGMSKIPDSLKAFYDATQSALLAESQAEAFMGHLKNCTLNETVRTNMYNSLLGMLRSGIVMTPDRIKSMLVDTFSLSLSDLCHPFLLSYSIIPDTRNVSTSYACEEDNLYSGLLAFLQRTDVRTEISTAPDKGSPSALTGSASFALDAGNAFESQFGTACTVTAYTEGIGGSCTDCFTTLIIAGTLKRDTLNCSARDGAARLHTVLAGAYSVKNVRCLNSDEKAMATGVLAQYTTVLDLSCPLCIVPQSFYVWSRRTTFMKPAPSTADLKNSITCVDIKKALEDFKTDKSTYQYSEATNHPLYTYTLTNYLNRKFNKNYGYGDYTALMNGCAVTDKVALKRQIAGYRIELNAESDVAGFLNTINNYGTWKPDYLRYQKGGKPIFLIDFNSIGEDSLLAYKNLLAGVSAVSKEYNYTPADDNTSLIFAPASCSFNPSSFASVYSTADVSVWDNDDDYTTGYKLYTLRQAAGATPLQEAAMIAGINDYLHNTALPTFPSCNSGYHFFGRELMRSNDYSTTLKQQYLAYIYGLPAYSHDALVAAVDPAVLGSHIAAYAGSTFTYDDPYCTGSRTHVYAYNPSPSPLPAGYNLVKNTILSAIGTKLFPDKDFTYITSMGSRLAVIRKANGEYWYRYFDTDNKLYNLYITPPSSAMAVPPEAYSFSWSTVKMGPHPNTFYVDVTYGAVTIKCSGHADFTLGNSVFAENVILDKNTKGVSCVDSLDCEYYLLTRAKENGRAAYRLYFDSTVNRISNDMMVHLLNTTKDTLIYCGQQQQYQQTLYYYDLAGNLTRTVPPAGVFPVSGALSAVVNNRNGAATDNKMTAHKKVSSYKYNSLNQLKYQFTPDGGTVYFFYDAAGRQIFSQNSRQRPQGFYTYSLYDEQGRAIESGEAQLGCVAAPSAAEFDTSYCPYFTHSGMPVSSAHPDYVTYAYDENTYSYAELASYIKLKPRKDVVVTFYDEQTEDLGAVTTEMLSTQENLRSRVAAIKYFTTLSTPALPAEPTFATYFSYDIGGNVKTISYDYPQLKTYDQRYKRVDYDYDLISGKVNMISYNRGHPDQFYQQYDFDADNRITLVNTSNDGLEWNKDARYAYYKHGPLATTKLGNQKVQSLEYAYTIQGWLKAINGDVLNTDKDMGKNGSAMSASPFPAGNDTTYARDVIAHALQYYKEDYAPIGTTPVVNLPTGRKNLYNGNIAQQTTGIGKLGTMQRTYQYDQLQRLVQATNQKVDDASAGLSVTPANLYKSAYTYDKDGNIKTLMRWDGKTGAVPPRLIDNFTYTYDAGAADNNKLLQVADGGIPTGDDDLQPGQLANNYSYDKTGNMILDRQGAEKITWNRLGKVASIYDTVSKRSIVFNYDGTGNRIWKEVVAPSPAGENHEGEYYVRDAGGNILAVYRTRTVLGRGIFAEKATDLASGKLSPVTPGGTVLTDVLVGMANTSYPTALKSLVLTAHGPWLSTYTDRPVSFYLAADPMLKSSLIYSGEAWIDALRTANASVYRNAFLAAGMDVQPMLSATLDYAVESKKLLELYSKNMSPLLCEPIWQIASLSYNGGDPAVIFPALTATATTGTGSVLYNALATLANTAYPTALISLMTNSHSSWVGTYTNRPISFYMGIDGALKANLLNSGDAWVDALRSANPALHRDALLKAGPATQPFFSAALNLPSEGIKLLQQYSTAMPSASCQPIWAQGQAQFIAGNHVANANNLYNSLNMNPQLKIAVINQLITRLQDNYAQSLPQAANFYNAVIADNTIWLSQPLRGQNGPLTSTVRSAVIQYGNPQSLGTFFDGWAGGPAALSACTAPDYKINALYNNNRAVVQDDMSREASRSEIATILSGVSGLSPAGFGTKLINAGAAAAPVRAAFPAPGTGNPTTYTANATSLFNSLGSNPQLKPLVAAQLATAITQDQAQSWPEPGAFFTAMVADNTLWQSPVLRAQNGPWTTGIRSITYNYADNTAFAAFFDAWSGRTAALDACTTPEYKLGAVYTSNPALSIKDMSAQIGNTAIAGLITGMADMDLYGYYDRLVTAGLDAPVVRAELLKSTMGDTMGLSEHHLYGSTRLGIQRYDSTSVANILRPVTGTERRVLKLRIPWYSYSYESLIDSTKKLPFTTVPHPYTKKWTVNRTLGRRFYELSDHLGNVLATVLDRRTGAGTRTIGSATFYDRWHADLASATDYYPGGMMMPGRNTEYSWSRMGYNGQAKDDEVYGKGNLNTALFWEMDTRIIRRWNVDPKPSSSISQYATFNNNPILFSDPLGDTTSFYTNTSKKPIFVLNDGNPNALNIIDEGNESTVMSLVNLYQLTQIDKWSDVEKVKNVSAGLQKYGVTYNLQSFSDFEANNQGAKATEITGSKGSYISFKGCSEFTLDGKPFTPRGEVIGNLVMKTGQVKAGLADVSSTNMSRSYSDKLPNEPGKINSITIHMHPKPGLMTFKENHGMMSVFPQIPFYQSGPSGSDRSGYPIGEKIRRVLVEGNKITLFNRDQNQDIIVDKPAPSKTKK